MKRINAKRLLLCVPYIFVAMLASKLGQAWRFSPGTDFSGKALHLIDGLRQAFQSFWPSLHPADLCLGALAAAALWLAVYLKGRNAKKFRKNKEYGSARWSA